MKKQTWIVFCILSAILFTIFIYTLVFWFPNNLQIFILMASVLLFAVPTLLCLDKKTRKVYAIAYAVSGMVMLLISFVGIFLIVGVTFGLITVVIATSNKGE